MVIWGAWAGRYCQNPRPTIKVTSVKPQVSVIMPAYNVAPYIETSIRSVLQQTCQDVELLVVDDQSTDETVTIIRRFTDHRVRLLQNERNRGQSYARNWAMEQARGEWLALLDADDWWATERLERLLAVAKQTQADLVADDLWVVPDGTEQPADSVLAIRGIRLQKPTQIPPVTFIKWDLGITKPLIRRAFWIKTGVQFDETMRAGQEDFPFFLRCLLDGASFVLAPEAYYFYRSRPGSMTSRRVRLFQKIVEATSEFFSEPMVRQDAELVAALQWRILHAERTIAYNQVRNSLQRGALATALWRACQTPGIVPFTLRRLSNILLWPTRHLPPVTRPNQGTTDDEQQINDR